MALKSASSQLHGLLLSEKNRFVNLVAKLIETKEYHRKVRVKT